MTEKSKSEEICRIWRDYENAKSYAAAAGLRKDLPTYVDFYEGKQWPPATKATKNLPRPVINIVKMICRSKKSSILSTPVRLVYEADDANVDVLDVGKFNAFAAHIQKEMGMEALDKRAVQNGIVEGTYIYHYYWDAEAEGKKAQHKGALRCEIIDPLSICFSDPTQPDEQKQKWIIVKSREEVTSVRAKADKGVDKDLIAPDDAEDPYGDIEQDGDKLCTVLTKYFRIGGEVHFEKAVKGTVVNAARPLCPDVEKELKKLRAADRPAAVNRTAGDGEEEDEAADAPNNTTPDAPGTGEDLRKRARCYLYPIVVGQYETRKGSIYGIGEVEGIIPNQKAINLMLAMVILNNREMAWGKYIVHPSALNGQKITDEPGQIITDYSPSGNGIRKLSETGLQGQPMNVIEMIAQLTRKMTGATEVLSGEVIGANMSGSAIAQLQAQAKEPVKELRDNFWLVKEKQGYVLAQFFKNYYAEEPFYMPRADMPRENMPGDEEQRMMPAIFNGADYADVDFSVVVDAVSGTNASSAGDISALDALYAKGAIDVETYVSCYPRDALSNRTELLRLIRAQKESQTAQMQEQMQQMQAQLQQYQAAVKQLTSYCEGQQKIVDQVDQIIKKNIALKAELAQVYAEAQGKIGQANEEIARGNRALAQTKKDAEDMARVLFENGLYEDPTNPMDQSGNG